MDLDIIARLIAYEVIYLRTGRDNTTVMIIALHKDIICSEQQKADNAEEGEGKY